MKVGKENLSLSPKEIFTPIKQRGRGRQKTLEEIVYKYPILHMLFVSVIKLIHKCLYPTLNNLCSFSLA